LVIKIYNLPSDSFDLSKYLTSYSTCLLFP
jgi:hypothetical protein